MVQPLFQISTSDPKTSFYHFWSLPVIFQSFYDDHSILWPISLDTCFFVYQFWLVLFEKTYFVFTLFWVNWPILELRILCLNSKFKNKTKYTCLIKLDIVHHRFKICILTNQKWAWQTRFYTSGRHICLILPEMDFQTLV